MVSSFDAFLMLYQTELLRTDATRRETADALVMIRQVRGQQDSHPLPKYLSEYTQKTSAVDPKIYPYLDYTFILPLFNLAVNCFFVAKNRRRRPKKAIALIIKKDLL